MDIYDCFQFYIHGGISILIYCMYLYVRLLEGPSLTIITVHRTATMGMSSGWFGVSQELGGSLIIGLA